MNKLLIVVGSSLLIFTAGCVAEVVDGRPHRSLSCYDDINLCHEQARRECKGEYTVVETKYEMERDRQHHHLVVACQVVEPHLR